VKEVADVAKIRLEGWRCERCGHEWLARKNWEDKPRVCARCKSPYWDTPRKTPAKPKKPKEDEKTKDAGE
jgi:DNA-directed RNA polymerase subunit RPC12/RpoP